MLTSGSDSFTTGFACSPDIRIPWTLFDTQAHGHVIDRIRDDFCRAIAHYNEACERSNRRANILTSNPRACIVAPTGLRGRKQDTFQKQTALLLL